MSSLAEGFDRNSKAVFHQFVVIAKGSRAEVRAQLYIALDVVYLNEELFLKSIFISRRGVADNWWPPRFNKKGK